jgi:transposase
MGSSRRQYDKQFKIEAVRLVSQGGKRATEVARDLGIHVNLIYKWQKELSEDQEYSFPGHGKLKPADEELRRLKRKLADVEEERDILKKALAIFSKHPR